jgi:serine/threonine protein kinase
VTLGIHKLTGKQVAIKTIDKAYMKDDFSRRKVFQEIYILKKIKHSNVTKLLEVFDSPNHVLIVMEYAGAGDLLHYVKNRKRLTEDKSRFIFKNVSGWMLIIIRLYLEYLIYIAEVCFIGILNLIIFS